MSEQSQPEFLEPAAGAPLRDRPRRRGRVVLAGAGVAGVALLGGAAYGAWWWLADGPQAAEALPASSIAYAGLTLDPSGEQKLAALETLQEFPSLSEELDLGGDPRDIDVKQRLAEAFLGTAPCEDLSYAEHLEPWLGDRLAVAAVPVDGEPEPVVALEVTDAASVDAGLEALTSCGSPGGGPGAAWAVEDGWVVLAEDEEILEDVADQAAEGTLADDADFTRWTDEAGDPGVLTLYAAPEAATYVAEELSSLSEDLGGDLLGTPVPGVSDGASDGASDGLSEGMSPSTGLVPDELTEALEDFAGAAVQVRFSEGTLEVEAAGGLPEGEQVLDEGAAADIVTGLPDDTVLAWGAGVPAGIGEQWAAALQDLGGPVGLAEGLDLEALLGDAAALAVGPGLDLEELFGSLSAPELPLAVVTTGDRAAADDAVARLDGAPLLGLVPDVTGEDGRVVLGLAGDWSGKVLAGGALGETARFRAAVPDADEAAGVAYADLDALVAAVGGAGADLEVQEDLEALSAFGASSRVDGDVTRLVLRLTTD